MISRSTLRIVVISLLAVFPAACGGGSSVELRTLTETDVTGMSTGNATGTTFSGTYVVDSGGIDGCRCRTGSCSEFSAQLGSPVPVQQQDGAITIQGCLGGVNEDGTFWCGGKGVIPGRLELAIDTGKFVLTNGKPTRVDTEIEVTLAAPIGGTPFDCDVKSHASARFAAGP